MLESHLRFLRCPSCRNALTLSDAQRDEDGRIESGRLVCAECKVQYPVRRHIPRFVDDDTAFGLEWTLHARTQYDERSGTTLTATRFAEETRWPSDLDGEVIIEAGSGSGRFTEQALATGATVLSLEYSRAVDANFGSNGSHRNLLLVQGDILRMPFPYELADRVFCFGVLQHTRDPRGALASLVAHLRPGGELAADIYPKSLGKYALGTKYWVRPITRRLPPEKLYLLTSRYVDLMWPVARLVRRIPKVGRPLNWRLLIGDYSGLIDDDNTLREWAKLDTFDMLAPEYDKPARLRTLRRWCTELPLDTVVVKRGYNGFEIHGHRAGAPATKRPALPASAFLETRPLRP
jgi:uncharacterized protein YbaR (Trm112 family)